MGIIERLITKLTVKNLALLLFLITLSQVGKGQSENLVIDHGAVVRSDTTKKIINLVFTGHEFADGFETIDTVLQRQQVKASFFFTGDFYRNPQFSQLIKKLKNEGHYLGAHSDRHLLYCTWENRNELLVSKDSFQTDLKKNYVEMRKFGVKKKVARYFLPPYEWHNDSIAAWTKALGLTLINYSAGTYSNADYTYPELGKQYLDSETILNRILQYEDEQSLNGFILLLHIGTDPRRNDKFYDRLDQLLSELKQRGYRFVSLEESISIK